MVLKIRAKVLGKISLVLDKPQMFGKKMVLQFAKPKIYPGPSIPLI